MYQIIYYIEMDLSTTKNGKIRPRCKDGTETLDSCWYQSLHKTSVLHFIKNGTSLYLGVSTGDKAEWVIYFAELSWFTSSLNTILHSSLLLAVWFFCIIFIVVKSRIPCETYSGRLAIVSIWRRTKAFPRSLFHFWII